MAHKTTGYLAEKWGELPESGELAIQCQDCGEMTAYWKPIEWDGKSVYDSELKRYIRANDYDSPIVWELHCTHCEAVETALEKECQHIRDLLMLRYGTDKPASIADWWTV